MISKLRLSSALLVIETIMPVIVIGANAERHQEQEQRQLQFGFTNGGIGYEDALQMQNRPQVLQDVDAIVANLNDANSYVFKNVKSCFNELTPGLTEAEVIYEMLNWDPALNHGHVDASLDQDQRNWLLGNAENLGSSRSEKARSSTSGLQAE